MDTTQRIEALEKLVVELMARIAALEAVRAAEDAALAGSCGG